MAQDALEVRLHLRVDFLEGADQFGPGCGLGVPHSDHGVCNILEDRRNTVQELADDGGDGAALDSCEALKRYVRFAVDRDRETRAGSWHSKSPMVYREGRYTTGAAHAIEVSRGRLE